MASTRGKLAGLLAAPLLGDLKKQLDYEQYGGAPLLGVRGVSIIAHGRSSATAIVNACAAAKRAVDGRLVELIGKAMENEVPSERAADDPDESAAPVVEQGGSP